MVAPTVTVLAPPPLVYPAGADGILRPQALVRWTGGTGPFNVKHQWDTVSSFDSGNYQEDANNSVTSPDIGVPPGNMGPAGTTWFYRVRVTDTSDAAFTETTFFTLTWFDQITNRRYLYLDFNMGVAFNPIDTTVVGENVDGSAIQFRRYLYLDLNSGVGFDPTDTPVGGWGPGGSPLDGYTIQFRRYLYFAANMDTTTPTPHIWYLYPTFGEEGWEYTIVGYGFGDTQGTYSGTVTLNGLASGVISWTAHAAVGTGMEIVPLSDVANPIHQEINAVVPVGATSGLVIVTTDGP